MAEEDYVVGRGIERECHSGKDNGFSIFRYILMREQGAIELDESWNCARKERFVNWK